MAKHVPLGEGTINDHEARLEKLEQVIAELKAGTLPDLTPAPQTETPKKKKDKD